MRRGYAFVEAFGLNESSVVAEDDHRAVTFASGDLRLTVAWSVREGNQWALGNAEEEVIYPGELAALNGTTIARFSSAFRRRSE